MREVIKFKAPFARTSIAYHVHFVIFPKKPDPPKILHDYRHALLVVVLAARLVGTALGVRKAAWEMLQKVDQVQYVEGEGGDVQKVWTSNFDLMMTIMWHPAPVKLVEMILAETETKKDEPVESEFEPERKSRRARSNSKKRKQSA
jgi:hypothetical protein